MLFLNSWIYTFAGTGLLCVMEPFIKVWIGKEFVLPIGVLVILVINFYIQGLRKTTNTFKEAAGVYYEDRFIPLWESLINIVVSIILVKKFGLAGVFMGTIISTFLVFFYSYPKFVYQPLFNRSYTQYLKDYIPYIGSSILVMMSTYFITTKIVIQNSMMQIIVNTLIVCIIPNVLYWLLFYQTKQFQYYKEILLKMIRKN